MSPVEDNFRASHSNDIKRPNEKQSKVVADKAPTTSPMKTKPHPNMNKKKVLPLHIQEEMLDAEFPKLPAGHVIPALTDIEMHKLIIATQSFEKERVFKTIAALQEQLKEHQSILDKLQESEHLRQELISRNELLEKEREDQEERISSLEHEVVELKLNLATEKSAVDYSRLSLARLSMSLSQVRTENDSLHKKLKSSLTDVDFTGYAVGQNPACDPAHIATKDTGERSGKCWGDLTREIDSGGLGESQMEGSVTFPSTRHTIIGTNANDIKSTLLTSESRTSSDGSLNSAKSDGFISPENSGGRRPSRSRKHSSLIMKNDAKASGLGLSIFSFTRDWIGNRNVGQSKEAVL